MKIKIEPFLRKIGNRVAKAAIEFESGDSFLSGFLLVGFTVCDDVEKGLFVLFPASISAKTSNPNSGKAFFFLRPSNDEQLGKLESLIIDEYERMIEINHPKEVNQS